MIDVLDRHVVGWRVGASLAIVGNGQFARVGGTASLRDIHAGLLPLLQSSSAFASLKACLGDF
ncbi:hypothetical protein [Burkholderia anthina]|uniref:hypothetical protein n=1 Tax=Burkholderia anthina TaxID=179879 RepID=UPI0015887DCA|nr:hypothetical protein [Burkholderia anthina]